MIVLFKLTITNITMENTLESKVNTISDVKLDKRKTEINYWELLGEVTADSISFDVEPYVDKMYFEVDRKSIPYFKDYNPLKKLLHDIYCFTDKNKSFYSLLQSKEIFFKHCCGNFIDDGVVGETCCHKPKGVVEKVVILKRL